jgi:hypothetical protein
MSGQPVPNIEDPRHLIRSLSDAPPPLGVGYVAPSWEPRRAHAGTYDEAWRTRRAPYLPLDFRPDFFLCAPPDQCVREFLRGGEPVELVNLSPAGVDRFSLPVCELDATVRVAGQSERPRLRLETVLLEPSEGRVCLLWRGAVPCDKRALKVEQVHLKLQRLGLE